MKNVVFQETSKDDDQDLDFNPNLYSDTDNKSDVESEIEEAINRILSFSGENRTGAKYAKIYSDFKNWEPFTLKSTGVYYLTNIFILNK